MAAELAPFLEAAGAPSGPERVGNAQLWTAESGGVDLVLVQSGIGLVNAASALTAVALRHRPQRVVSVGTAGGIRGLVEVGDVVVANEFTYSTANAVEFGYVLGQVPGMPARFAAESHLVERVVGRPGVVVGPIASGDVFVAGHVLEAVLTAFPDIVAVDMESTALAHVCSNFTIPFASVRGISDLCGPGAAAEHAITIAEVSARSAQVAGALLRP